MKKNIVHLINTICIIVVLFNVYILSLIIVKSNDILYSKLNSVSYDYNLAASNNIYKKQSITKEAIIDSKEEVSDVLETFIGEMTAYGPDCRGCSGVTSFGYDMKNGNVNYFDKKYGSVRIVAADRKYPFGTIIRVSNLKIYNKPFLAVVLDRGGAIKGNKMDLAFDTQRNPLVRQLGFSRNVQYEILRYGW